MNYLSFNISLCRINGYGKRNTSIRFGLYSKYTEDTRLILIAKAVESLCRAGLHARGRLKTKKQFSDGLLHVSGGCPRAGKRLLEQVVFVLCGIGGGGFGLRGGAVFRG